MHVQAPLSSSGCTRPTSHHDGVRCANAVALPRLGLRQDLAHVFLKLRVDDPEAVVRTAPDHVRPERSGGRAEVPAVPLAQAEQHVAARARVQHNQRLHASLDEAELPLRARHLGDGEGDGGAVPVDPPGGEHPEDDRRDADDDRGPGHPGVVLAVVVVSVPCQERAHVENAGACKHLEQVGDPGAVRQQQDHAAHVRDGHRHREVELREARHSRDEGQVDQEVLGQEDNAPPVDVGPELDEEELPAHLKTGVMEVLRSHNDGAHKQAAHPEDVDQYENHAHPNHLLPLVALEADDAQVCRQRLLAVGVAGALEEQQGAGRDGAEEGEHDGPEDVQQPVPLHLQLGAPQEPGQQEGDAEGHQAEEGGGHGVEAARDHHGGEVCHADAVGLEHAGDVVREGPHVKGGAGTAGHWNVGTAYNVDDLIVVQRDERQRRNRVLPSAPPVEGVAEELVEQHDDRGADDQRQHREEDSRSLDGGALGALPAIPVVAIHAVLAGD
mmetsp:Transcript_19511/g.56656  ORF Transcript_19511/g.56656 Transcript_19511/m.56656 type:complete len:498 (-) Transcript_19511:4-1497(-)